MADQRSGIEPLVVQTWQQQVEKAGNMQAMQTERESMKSSMEQFILPEARNLFGEGPRRFFLVIRAFQ